MIWLLFELPLFVIFVLILFVLERRDPYHPKPLPPPLSSIREENHVHKYNPVLGFHRAEIGKWHIAVCASEDIPKPTPSCYSEENKEIIIHQMHAVKINRISGQLKTYALYSNYHSHPVVRIDYHRNGKIKSTCFRYGKDGQYIQRNTFNKEDILTNSILGRVGKT